MYIVDADDADVIAAVLDDHLDFLRASREKNLRLLPLPIGQRNVKIARQRAVDVVIIETDLRSAFRHFSKRFSFTKN